MIVPPYSCAVMRDGTKQKMQRRSEMKILIIAVVIAVILSNAFLFLCLLRVSSAESRREEKEADARNRREG